MKKFLRWTFILVLGVLLFITTILGCGHIRHTVKITPPDAQVQAQFEGSFLTLSDADQIGTAYADGIVNKIKGIEDSLCVVSIREGKALVHQSTSVSNSVISWPSVMDVSPDGRWAYVAETRGAFPDAREKVEDVYSDTPDGRWLSVVDLQSGEIVQKKDLGKNLCSASLNARGDLLVSGSAEPGKELVLAQIENGLITQVHTFPGWVEDDDREGVRMVIFHPEQDIIAVNNDNRRLSFFSVQKKAGKLRLTRLGLPLEVAKKWSVGIWHPQGNYFILSDVAWGNNSTGFVLNSRGKLISVAYDPGGQHRIVSQVKVGLSPEGFDLSPDGKWAIVVNMRRTYLPKGFPYALFSARGESSLSLVQVDPENGQLQVKGKEYGFEGELPEDAIFDHHSKGIAVAIYNKRYESLPRQGFVEIWQRQGEKLVRTGLKIPVTRGVHNLLRVPTNQELVQE